MVKYITQGGVIMVFFSFTAFLVMVILLLNLIMTFKTIKPLTKIIQIIGILSYLTIGVLSFVIDNEILFAVLLFVITIAIILYMYLDNKKDKNNQGTKKSNK